MQTGEGTKAVVSGQRAQGEQGGPQEVPPAGGGPPPAKAYGVPGACSSFIRIKCKCFVRLNFT